MTKTDSAMIRVIGLLIWFVALTLARPNPRPGGLPKRKIPLPGSGFRLREPHTNLTMDQIMTQQLGGISGLGNKMMDADGLILAELDLRLTPEQYAAFYNTNSNGLGGDGTRGRSKRKATTDPVLKWFHGEIPYTFAENTFNAKEKMMIKEAMTEWERYTCIKFVEATPSHPNVVDFVNGDSCSSQLGMVGGRQMLMLQTPGCRYRGLYLHEIAHAIGLIHEHQRPDRDSYVDIFLQHVDPQLYYSFTKRTKDTGVYNTTYEYSSVMHYSVLAFSKDGMKTILPKDRSREEEIGNVFLKELSFGDIMAVNNMYTCGGNCPDTVKCKDGGFVDETCRCICPDGTRDCEEGYQAPATNGECHNTYDDWQCAVWANSGQCTRNSKFMSKSCTKACQLCSYTVAPTERAVCEDLHPKKCAKWKENGDCVANEWWMSLNCRKTCNACVAKSQRKETQCENKYSDSNKCDNWAADGECKINPAWMLINCRKSCQTCDQTPPVTDETDDSCKDIHSNKQQCVDWAQSGECQANPSWMLLNCKKSCGVCGGGSVVTKAPVKCLDTNAECPSWAETGECLKNPGWMLKNCRVSCEVCVPDSVSTPNPVTPDLTHPTVGPQVPCNNLHDDSECGLWASTGHCEVNPSWMHYNCRKACRVCIEVTSSPPVKPDCTCRNSGSPVLRPSTITLLMLAALLVALTSKQQ